MSVSLIILCIVLPILLILTEKIYIVIKQEERFFLEFHFVFIALSFQKKKRKNKSSLSAGFYREIIKRLKPLIKKSEIVVDYISPPAPADSSSPLSLLSPLGFYFSTCALSVIASQHARRVEIGEKCAASFFEKSNSARFKLSLHVRLYHVVYSLIPILFKLFSTKKKSKRAENV